MRVTVPGNLKGTELFKYLCENKSDLIKIAKSSFKEADSFSLHTVPPASVLKSSTDKREPGTDKVDVTLVGNTYGWLDSHDDVHIDGIFTKSLTESGSKVLHLHDHVRQLTAKVGRPQKVYEQSIKWADLGISKVGSTIALMMDSEVLKAYNPMIFEDYSKGEINQHSVGMIYVQLFLCVNDPEYKMEFADWNKYIGYVGNREKAEEQGYFWAVTEAKLVEISCVIAGSNELTPTLNVKTDTTTEPPEGTQEEPSAGSTDKADTVSKLFIFN